MDSGRPIREPAQQEMTGATIRPQQWKEIQRLKTVGTVWWRHPRVKTRGKWKMSFVLRASGTRGQ